MRKIFSDISRFTGSPGPEQEKALQWRLEKRALVSINASFLDKLNPF
jgi:hypothetical protein